MKERKLQVFVSSTFTDLIEERQAAVEAILSSGHIPAGMELFSAGDESQMTVIKRWIDESDVYLLILGGRYGSIDNKTGKSYTELEYEYAVETHKPLFTVIINDNALEEKIKLAGSLVIEKENPKLLSEFKSKVSNNLVKFWDDKKDIKLAIHETLSDFSYRKELNGWIRGDNSVNAGILAEEIARLTKENSDLRNRLQIIDGNSNSLYAGLSFTEMKDLLNRHEITERDGTKNGTKMSLFDFIILKGSILSRPVAGQSINANALDKLITFKLAQSKYDHINGFQYNFTEDGHNFYLKSLL